jgi:tetratricopeptide (TPR) repeat protein
MNPDNDIEILGKRAFRDGDYDTALECYKKLLPLHYPSAYYTCGLIYETGSSKEGIDIEKAYRYFNQLRIEWGDSEGDVGCARIIVNSNWADKAELARSFCENAIARDKNPFAYLLLGRINEEYFNNHTEARKAFLTGALRGSAWSMRLYARSVRKHKSKVLGIIIHIIVTILYPLYLIFGGLRATRFG